LCCTASRDKTESTSPQDISHPPLGQAPWRGCLPRWSWFPSPPGISSRQEEGRCTNGLARRPLSTHFHLLPPPPSLLPVRRAPGPYPLPFPPRSSVHPLRSHARPTSLDTYNVIIHCLSNPTSRPARCLDKGSPRTVVHPTSSVLKAQRPHPPAPKSVCQALLYNRTRTLPPPRRLRTCRNTEQ